MPHVIMKLWPGKSEQQKNRLAEAITKKQRPRRRLWLNDGSCVRLRPERANHVWSYDFVLIDEYTRESLAIRVARRLGRYEVIEALADVMLFRGIPENIRSDNGPEFVAKELRQWLAKVGTGTLYIDYANVFTGQHTSTTFPATAFMGWAYSANASCPLRHPKDTDLLRSVCSGCPVRVGCNTTVYRAL
jgi:hypothetical protein